MLQKLRQERDVLKQELDDIRYGSTASMSARFEK